MSSATPKPGHRISAADRLLVPFAERSPAEQLIGGLIVPVIFGVLCGVVLGWSAPAYWLLQAIAAIGGVAGGFEHRGARAGAARGVAGGLVFGSAILLGHAIAGTDEVVEGAAPAILPAVAVVVGSALGALGGGRRRAFDARRVAAAG